jgi:hydrogenase maturation protease
MAWLVVGFGSDLAGDDRFGLAVAHSVAQRKLPVDILTKRILGPELIEKIRGADGVIFVDASASLPPGALQCISLQDSNSASCKESRQSSSAIAISHYCDPLMLMQLTETLYDKRPQAWLYVVGGYDFGFSERMSPAVEARVSEVAEKIISQIGASRSEKSETL